MTDHGNELGQALRSWRDRLAPADAGLRSGRGRRASGLRREELAQIAGLSVDYVVRLEQGRATTPSAQVVGALARALQLSTDERDHLYRLARLLPPQDRRITDHVPPGVQRLVARLGETAVAVFSADWTLISWSPLWAALLGDPADVPVERRNLVRACFPVPGETPGLVASWPVRADRGRAAQEAALVGDLRRATATYPDDPRLARLVTRSRAGNARFAELWDTGTVATHASDRKTVEHPGVGPLTVDCDILTVPGADLTLVAYTAAVGSPDAGKLDLLRVTGTAHSLS